MKKKAVRIAIALLALLVVAASQAAAAQSEMLVSTAQLAASLKDPKLVLLQVGFNSKAYDAGHIPGARLVLWKDIAVTRNGAANQPIGNQMPPTEALRAALEKVGVSDDSRVIIYGDVPLPATYIYYVLDYFGQKNHAVFMDGLDKWTAEKRPVDKVVPTVTPGKLTGKPRTELAVDLATAQKMVAEKKVLFVDARPADHFSGATVFPDTPRGGHIPGAKNVFWMSTLATKDSPTLKSAADIKALYQAAGIKPDQEVVTYCRSGLQATHAYFTLKLAGFRPIGIFNGSFGEWSQAPGTVVEK